MDSIDSIESSLTPGRGRGSTSPFSILLMTCRILLSAAPARASISPWSPCPPCASLCLSCAGLPLSPLLLTYAHVASPTSPGSPNPPSCLRGILRPRCRLSRILDGLFPNLRYIGRFSGLRRFGWDRWLARLPAHPVCCGIAEVAPPSSKLALAFIRTSLPASFARRAKSTPRILEMRAISSVSSTRSCQLTSFRPPDELPNFPSRPERSTDPVVLSRGLPPVATRVDLARLCGEGRDLSS